MDRLPDRQPERERDRGCAYPGNPGRPSAVEKRRRIELLARTLADGSFDRLREADRVLLLQVATLMLQPRRKGEDPLRKANSIGRLLARVRGLHAASPSASSFTDEIL
jgi:hypothetical protein